MRHRLLQNYDKEFNETFSIFVLGEFSQRKASVHAGFKWLELHNLKTPNGD